MRPYTRKFFQEITEGSRRSAQELVPLILRWVNPRSVIDVGCGVGVWLAVFQEHGLQDFLGVDGDYVDQRLLQIPADRFRAADLQKPLSLPRQFDLVVSLEVAEHLPPECAETFVDSLARLGPVVLFSAAIPFQGGTHHVNEQWPAYWATLFQQRRFIALDCLRAKLWDNPSVEWWYAQNLQLFVREDQLGRYPELEAERERAAPMPLPLVHPKCYLAAADPESMSLKRTLSLLPRLIVRSLARRLRRLSSRRDGNVC